MGLVNEEVIAYRLKTLLEDRERGPNRFRPDVLVEWLEEYQCRCCNTFRLRLAESEEKSDVCLWCWKVMHGYDDWLMTWADKTLTK